MLSWFKKEVLCSPLDGSPYMERYVLFQCKWFRLYLHHFIAGDWSRDPHDHPRWFKSFGLWGGYAEEIYHEVFGAKDYRCYGTDYYHAPFYNHIPAERVHRILDPLPNTWTLCIGGPTKKGWGFYTQDGYVDHKDYAGGIE